MKTYRFSLSKSLLPTFFPEKRIKSKIEIIQILLEATRFMLVNPDISKDIEGNMLLHINKMSRLFFFTHKKYYSIVFPFFTSEVEANFKFSFFDNIDVDSALISKVISTIKCNQFMEKCSLDFISTVVDYEEEHIENIWIFLREILLMEDGYIRYDWDEENHDKAKKSGNEHLHPLNHYDLFYTSNATFKIGLLNSINEDDFIDLLDISTDCKYLSEPTHRGWRGVTRRGR